MSDYIDREAVLDLAFTGKIIANCNFKKVCKLIEDIPAADVRPMKRGKWELDNDGLPVCSECGEVALQRLFINLPKLIPDIRMMRSNFCPNCGADMRGEIDV